jgi:GH18 family chitinase
MTYDYSGCFSNITGHNAPLYAGVAATNGNVDATIQVSCSGGYFWAQN